MQQQDAHLIGPCSIEEADSHMMLHVAHATQHGYHQILVRTVDTDVVVLAVMVAETLPAKHEVWVNLEQAKFPILGSPSNCSSSGIREVAYPSSVPCTYWM